MKIDATLCRRYDIVVITDDTISERWGQVLLWEQDGDYERAQKIAESIWLKEKYEMSPPDGSRFALKEAARKTQLPAGKDPKCAEWAQDGVKLWVDKGYIFSDR